MAYTNHRYEVIPYAADGTAVIHVDLASTGDKLVWSPGFVKHIVRGVAAVILNDVGATGTINFDKRIVVGSDSGRVSDVITALALTTAHTAGKIVYRKDLNVTIDVGMELVVAVDDAAAAGDTCRIVLWVEAVYENPSNNTLMVASA